MTVCWGVLLTGWLHIAVANYTHTHYILYTHYTHKHTTHTDAIHTDTLHAHTPHTHLYRPTKALTRLDKLEGVLVETLPGTTACHPLYKMESMVGVGCAKVCSRAHGARSCLSARGVAMSGPWSTTTKTCNGRDTSSLTLTLTHTVLLPVPVNSDILAPKPP